MNINSHQIFECERRLGVRLDNLDAPLYNMRHNLIVADEDFEMFEKHSEICMI